jgi:flavodoxin
MKTLIIYSSVHHGNTKKIAEVTAQELSAELLNANDKEPASIEQYELIGFSSGIYYGKFHSKLYEMIEKLDLKGKNVFIFSTSGMGNKKYNESLYKLLTSKGAVVKGSFSCKGYDTYGPFKIIGGISKGHPNEKDLENARKFAKNLLR